MGNAPDTTAREITALVESLRQKYGLGSRPERTTLTKSWKSPQLQLNLSLENTMARTKTGTRRTGSTKKTQAAIRRAALIDVPPSVA